MKLHQLQKVLLAQSRALNSAEDGAASLNGEAACESKVRLVGIAAAFEPVGAQTVASVCTKLRKVKREDLSAFPESHDVIDLASILSVRMLVEVLEAAGAKSAAKELGDIATGLSPFEGCSVSQLVSKACEPQVATGSSSGRSRKNTKNSSLDYQSVRMLADRLTSASGNDQEFKPIVSEIKSMKLSKTDISTIANMFLGRDKSLPFKSAKQALDKIEERHFLDALSASRARVINRINV